jgi:hypothetical protein
MTTGKRNTRDLREENIDEENTKNIANDTFVDEIDQLSVSDDDVKRE